jgi:hypothetical protein
MMIEVIRSLLVRCALIIIFSGVVTSLASSCFDDSYEGGLSANRPPTVQLVSGPPEGSETNYRIHFYWHGFDSDGDIRYFEYAIADNDNGAFNPADTTGRSNWTRTTDYDKQFLFSADEIADTSSNDMITQFERSHTFFIRAVDDKGLASTRPAYRSFTATTLSPTVDITVPAYPGALPVLVPGITNFHWTATDYIDNTQNTQNPDSVRWILLDCNDFNDDPSETLDYIRKHPGSPDWSDWHAYLGPNGQSWTSPPLDYGTSMFAVQAKDEAGAVTPVFDLERNVRWIVKTSCGWPPGLTLRNEFIPALYSSVDGQHCWIVNLPAGLDMVFEWSGSANSSGSTIEGYRYGWDIVDLNIDEQWAIDWTPFNGAVATSPPQTYYYGTHTFHVEIKDTSGFKSRICLKINFIPFTMDKSLLVVDDFAEPNSIWSLVVTDEDHDNFWQDMVRNVDGFEPTMDVVEVSRDLPLSIAQLAQYKSIIWNVHGGHELPLQNMPLLHDYIKFISEEAIWPFEPVLDTNLLALYMAVGGHVLICGEQPMTTAINPDYLTDAKYPLLLQYELGGDQSGNYADQINDPDCDQAFPFQDMCLDVLDLAYPCPTCLRTSANGCDATGLRGVRPKEDGLRECVPIDLDFPALTLRPEFTGPGAIYDPDISGLQSELYNPDYFNCGYLDLGPRQCFEPIYGLGCQDLVSNLYSSPVAVWTSVFENVVPDAPGGLAARSALWGFEPFFFDTTAVRSALEVILFDEWQLDSK